MLFEKINQHDPLKIALSDGKRFICYGDIISQISIKQEQLKGARSVAIDTDNSIDWILWDLACLESNIPITPIPPFFTQEQKEHALLSSGCDVLITATGLVPLTYKEVALNPETAKITYTSGTTGKPKGVCLSKKGLETVVQSLYERMKSIRIERHLSILPFAILLENIAGVYTALYSGCEVVIPSLNFFGENYKNLKEKIRVSQAESIILVPEILRILMAQMIENPIKTDLKFIAVGGAKVDQKLIERSHEIGLPVFEGYGLSECGSVISLNTPEFNKSGTSGKILPHVQYAIVNDEIVIKNPVFLGYAGQNYQGSLMTGDIGSIDKKGYLTISGRKKNVLITSYGRNISPEWIESQFLSYPEIYQAFVYGDSLPFLKALIVPFKQGVDVCSIVNKINSLNPDYAHIKEFQIVDPFSIQNGFLTGNGKMKRNKILSYYQKEKNMKFFDELKKQTQQQRNELYSVPQLVDGLQGNISRETYIAYLTEAFHHVKHTVRFLMAMGVHLSDDKKWLHDAISEYIEEEKGHEEWILNDIQAAGGDKEKARKQTPNLETQVLVSYNYDYISRKNPVGFLGMVFMLESTSIQMANQGADAIKKELDLPNNAFSYLYSHGALDMEHMKFFEKLINQVTDEEDKKAIVEVAQNTFKLFANVLRSIPHQSKGALHAA